MHNVQYAKKSIENIEFCALIFLFSCKLQQGGHFFHNSRIVLAQVGAKAVGAILYPVFGITKAAAALIA